MEVLESPSVQYNSTKHYIQFFHNEGAKNPKLLKKKRTIRISNELAQPHKEDIFNFGDIKSCLSMVVRQKRQSLAKQQWCCWELIIPLCPALKWNKKGHYVGTTVHKQHISTSLKFPCVEPRKSTTPKKKTQESHSRHRERQQARQPPPTYRTQSVNH